MGQGVLQVDNAYLGSQYETRAVVLKNMRLEIRRLKKENRKRVKERSRDSRNILWQIYDYVGSTFAPFHVE